MSAHAGDHQDDLMADFEKTYLSLQVSWSRLEAIRPLLPRERRAGLPRSNASSGPAGRLSGTRSGRLKPDELIGNGP